MSTSAYVSVNRRQVKDFESLRQAVHASTSEIVQVDKGRMSGCLTQVSVADFAISAGDFSLGVRSHGVFSSRRLTFGILLNTSEKVLRMSREMQPGDIGVVPPGMEHHSRYHGRTAFAAISVSPEEFSSFIEWEPALNDLGIWRNGAHLRADAETRRSTAKRLSSIISWIGEHGQDLSVEAAGYWKRSVLEFVTASVMRSFALEERTRMASAVALVRRVEDYLNEVGSRPVHISELCTEFHVSRRSLHRAFGDILGVAPVAYLRHKRLCSVHSVLRDSNPSVATVANVAMQQGFIELGRFSRYYRSLFGEYPSQTLGLRSGAPPRPAAKGVRPPNS